MPSDFNDTASLLGSIASIGAIPLTLWLFLRSQEEKEHSTRREIIHTLSFQLGEGRPLSRFEVQAVTASLLRRKKLKTSSISIVSVVNDLVCETLANPMLSPERKEAILGELEKILSFRSTEPSDSNPSAAVPSASHRIEDESKAEATSESRMSSFFGIAAVIGVILGTILSARISSLDLVPGFEYFISLIFGVGASAFATWIYDFLSRRKDSQSSNENANSGDADRGVGRK